MKNIIMIVVGILFASHSFGQVFEQSKKDIKTKNVPDDAVSALNAKYGSDVIAKWERKGSDYYAAFEIDKTNYEVKFSDKGGWLETAKQIKADELPDAVNELLFNGNYRDWVKADIVFVQRATGENRYRVSVIKDEQKRSLLITPEGKIDDSDKL